MPIRTHIARVHKGRRGPPPADARDCDWEGTVGSVSCLVGQWEGARSSFVAFPATLQSDRPFSFVVPVAWPPRPAEAFLAFYSCAATMGPAESSPPPRALCGGGGHDDGGGGRTAEAGLADGGRSFQLTPTSDSAEGRAAATFPPRRTEARGGVVLRAV
jgi:hypothetical protein